ncbi:MAG TPA: hypothetical protein VM760_08240, partial [Sphingomicrobium sp.]|nr:hypothetical protein [Sphingomicrobium sp.]
MIRLRKILGDVGEKRESDDGSRGCANARGAAPRVHRRSSGFDHGQQVFFAHDEQFFAVDLDFGA